MRPYWSRTRSTRQLADGWVRVADRTYKRNRWGYGYAKSQWTYFSPEYVAWQNRAGIANLKAAITGSFMFGAYMAFSHPAGKVTAFIAGALLGFVFPGGLLVIAASIFRRFTDPSPRDGIR